MPEARCSGDWQQAAFVESLSVEQIDFGISSRTLNSQIAAPLLQKRGKLNIREIGSDIVWTQR